MGVAPPRSRDTAAGGFGRRTSGRKTLWGRHAEKLNSRTHKITALGGNQAAALHACCVLIRSAVGGARARRSGGAAAAAAS